MVDSESIRSGNVLVQSTHALMPATLSAGEFHLATSVFNCERKDGCSQKTQSLSPHICTCIKYKPLILTQPLTQPGINPIVHLLWYISINQASGTAQSLLATFVTLTFRLMVHSMGSPFPTL